MIKNQMQIFTGTGNPDLANKICDYLNLPLGDASVGTFPDGEIDVKLNDDVRGSDVFIVQSTCPPVNDSLMELLIMIDSLRRASAGRITAVMPYFGYARQDRKAEGRVPITAKLVANLITQAGADRALTMELHAAQIQGFVDIPVDHMFASPVIVDYFQKIDIPDLVVVSPDAGSIKTARAYAKRLNAGLAIVDKRRSGADLVDVMHVIGDVEGKNAILVDDMISTGGSICQAAAALRENGCQDIFICATHAVFCGPAVERLKKADVRQVVVTDSIPLTEDKRFENLKVLTVAELLGEAIRRIHRSESVSSLFV
jgi:ribose-phosphate pyrophosphokinase